MFQGRWVVSTGFSSCFFGLYVRYRLRVVVDKQAISGLGFAYKVRISRYNCQHRNHLFFSFISVDMQLASTMKTYEVRLYVFYLVGFLLKPFCSSLYFLFFIFFYGFDISYWEQNWCVPSPNFSGLASSALLLVFRVFFKTTSCLGLGKRDTLRSYRSVTLCEIKLGYSGLTWHLCIYCCLFVVGLSGMG